MCEQCGQDRDIKKYLVHNGNGTEIDICDECAEWLQQGQPDYDYVQISQKL